MRFAAIWISCALWSALPTNVLADDQRLPLFHGEWALNGRHCGEIYGNGVAEDNFIVIGRGTFQMYESSCRITQVRQLNEQDWSTVLQCQSEGEAVTQGWAIKKHSPYRFTVLNGAGAGRDYELCR